MFRDQVIAGTLHLTAPMRIMKKSPSKNPAGHLGITLPTDLAEWVCLRAKLQKVAVEQVVIEAIRYYQLAGIEDRPQITKAIAEGSPTVKTGRYEA